jgi:hypothetical protein
MFYLIPLISSILILSSCTSYKKTSFHENQRLPAGSESNKIVCKKTSSDIFKKKNTHKPFEVTLTADQENLQKNENYEDEKIYPSLIQFLNKDEKVTLPVLLSQRGNSRRDSCTFKPLKLEFLNTSVNQMAIPKTLSPDQVGFEQEYFQNLQSLYLKNQDRNRLVDFNPTKQERQPFKGLGKSLKIVSHCGRSDWSAIDEKTKEKQEQVLLQEYYIYKIQKILNPLTLDTQLIKLNYQDQFGKKTESALGFFREQAERTAKRCGFDKLNGAPEDYKTNKASAYQAEFTMLLLNNYDYGYNDPDSKVEFIRTLDDQGNSFRYTNDFEAHNIEVILSKDKEIYTIPYDFDLSILIRDSVAFSFYTDDSESIKQEMRDWWAEVSTQKKRVKVLQEWITADDLRDGAWNSEKDETPALRLKRGAVNIENFLNKKSKIKNLIKKSLLSKDNKKKFEDWLKLTTEGLEKTLKEIKDTL